MKGNKNSPWIETTLKLDGLRLKREGWRWRWTITMGDLTVTDTCFGRSRAAEQQAALFRQMLIVQRPAK